MQMVRVPVPVRVFLSILLFLSSAWGFTYVWDLRAIKSQSLIGSTFQGDKNITAVNFKLSFENYVLTDERLNLTFTYANSSTPLYVNELAMRNFTIDRRSYQLFYGSEPLGPPTIRHNETLSGFNVPVRRLSRLDVEINYHYSSDGFGPLIVPQWERNVRLTFLAEALFFVGNFEVALRSLPYRPFSILIPVITFLVLGMSFAWVESGKLHKLSDAFNGIGKKKGVQLKDSLATLAYKPNLLGYGFGTFFAPAITLFKMMVHRGVNSLYYNCKLDAKTLKFPDNFERHATKSENDGTMESRVTNSEEEDIESLEGFLGNDAAKPAATLFELRTVSLVIGFLGSVGLTFAWNIGAIGPFLIALGLTYLSVNFGFLAVIIVKSRGNMVVLGVLILVMFLVISISDIITTLRYLPP